MSVPMMALTIGASLGVGAMSVPVLGSVLSKPITGAVVPTRITDLAGYLTGGGGKGLGFEDSDLEQSIGDVSPGVGASANTSATSPVVPHVSSGSSAPSSTVNGATAVGADAKRMLAVASFGGGLVLAFAAFVLVRRVVGA